MACDAQTLIDTAYAAGYSKLSDRALWECIVASACAGGGGGGGNAITAAVTDPVGNGTTTGDLWINELSAQLWYWSGSAWNQLIGA